MSVVHDALFAVEAAAMGTGTGATGAATGTGIGAAGTTGSGRIGAAAVVGAFDEHPHTDMTPI